jgi:signal transduction histidine kinase
LQIVICTAYSDYSFDDIASRIGASDRLLFLKKPFDVIEVLQLVNTLTEKWRLSRQAGLRVRDLEVIAEQRTRELSAANEKLQQDIAGRIQSETRLAAFARLGQQLSAAGTIKEAAQIIVEVADQLLGWDACICDLYSPAEDLVENVLTLDLIGGRRTECTTAQEQHPPAPLTRRALREGVLILRDSSETMQANGLAFGDTSRPSSSILFVPIRNAQQAIGVLSIQSYQPGAYDQRSLATLQALADHCGGALDRIKTITERDLLEQQFRQAQKMEAVGQLAGGVAHDFNNLLTVISGHAELLLIPGWPGRDPGESLKQILAASNRAANLTRQLLAFSRKQVMQTQPLNLNEVIGNCTKMLQRIIGEDLHLQCNYEPRLPLIQADVGMIEQVLVNLVVNARDAMPAGGHLVISTETVCINSVYPKTHPEAHAGEAI